MKLKHIHRDKDRHGKDRIYFRKGVGQPKVRMLAKPGSADFYAEYSRLLAGEKKPPAPADLTKRGYVYFLKIGGYIKIGFSVKPMGRLKDLAGGASGPVDFVVVIPATLRDERHFHTALAKYRTNGEWFNDVRPVRMAAIRSLVFRKPMFDTDDMDSPHLDAHVAGVRI